MSPYKVRVSSFIVNKTSILRLGEDGINFVINIKIGSKEFKNSDCGSLINTLFKDGSL